jgi:hypothetical protein
VKRALLALLAPALLLLAAGAQADDESSSRRPPQRIIFGQTEQTDFQFRELPPLQRRSDAWSGRAYFGSGTEYSATLARLRAQMDALRARRQLEELKLTPAQQAVKEGMAPALVRALALSQRAREQAAD